MPVAAAIFLTFFLFIITFTVVWLIRNFGHIGKNNLRTQHLITDKELLQLIARQPDGLLSVKQLMQHVPGLSKIQAKKRLYTLQVAAILQVKTSKNLGSYYNLYDELDQRPPPTLSPEPFLTTADLMVLFKHFNYRLTGQHLIMATGLPWHTLKHEISYFEKKQIIQKLSGASSPYSSELPTQFYVLRDPYRTNPDQFLAKEITYNLELKELLKRSDLL